MRSCGRPREGSRLARRRLPGPPRPPPLPACGATRCRPRPGPRRANSGRPPGRRDRGRPGRLLPSAPECSQPFCLRARERAAGSIGNRISYAVCALDRILRTVSTDTEARRPSEAIAERCSLQTNVALDTASEPAHLLRRLRGRRGGPVPEGARGAAAELQRFLDRLGALYLDTGESRGLVPDDHPSVVAAARGTAMAEADVVVTVGRRLDFQLAFGSPAVFGSARFVRIADTG